jgi:glycosyltransferase involved in cell wall biosynthesis
MRICIATGLYPPDIGGPATFTVFLEKHAHALGLTLRVVPFGRVRTLPPGIRHLWYLILLIRASRGCVAILALDTISVGLPARIAALLLGKKFILRVPGDYAWEQGQQRYGVRETLDEFQSHAKQPLPVRFMRWLQAHVARSAAYIIVPSDYMKTIVSGWGVAPAQITRIYSVLKEIAPGTSPSDRSRDDFTLTTAARLVPWKGIDTLIDVVASLRDRGVPLHLNIIGDGVCREALEERVWISGTSSSVTFFGALSREALGAQLRASDAFILNTSYEGLSHQLIEVMSLGVPIITTPVGGNVELITNEVTGLLVPYNDREKIESAILRLRDDRELGETLAKRAAEAVHRFDETAIVEAWKSFFATVWK